MGWAPDPLLVERDTSLLERLFPIAKHCKQVTLKGMSVEDVHSQKAHQGAAYVAHVNLEFCKALQHAAQCSWFLRW